MRPSPERIAMVERLKDTLRWPLTPAERSAYNQARATEMARAEARRRPEPQLPLDGIDGTARTVQDSSAPYIGLIPDGQTEPSGLGSSLARNH